MNFNLFKFDFLTRMFSLTTATEKQAFLDAIFAIIGNNPSLKPHFMENGIKSLSDGTTEVVN